MTSVARMTCERCGRDVDPDGIEKANDYAARGATVAMIRERYHGFIGRHPVARRCEACDTALCTRPTCKCRC